MARRSVYGISQKKAKAKPKRTSIGKSLNSRPKNKHKKGGVMNIWVEYFKYEDSRKNTWAQIRENPKWNPPDSDKISNCPVSPCSISQVS